jgi:AcrR family transcriptional regulator
MEASAPARPTRKRILDAALAMFAEKGYEGTSIAELERASGLSPGSGALYRHFSSKRELLDEALRERMGAIEQMRSQLALGPLGDLRSELTLLARWGLAELDRERLLVAIVMREGPRLPEVVAGFRAAVVDPAHAIARESLERYASERGLRLADPEALAVALTASMVGFALQGQMLGRDFTAIDDEGFIAAWVETAAALIENAPKEEGR